MVKNLTVNKFIWGISLLVSVFVNFPFIALQLPHLTISDKPPQFRGLPPDHHPHFERHEMAGWDIFIQISLCLIFAIIITSFFYRPFILNTQKRIFYVVALLLGFVACLSSLNYFFIGIHEGAMVITVLIRGVLILGISYIISSFLKENEQKNAVLLENEHLKQENLLIQLNSLKNQLNPHFLFNSLNTLSWLINDNTEKSQLYLQKLSQVLRYSLSMQEQSLVTVGEELTLIDNYIFLLQMRFGENLKVTKNIENIEQYKIPPLSLQLLIENAIKHNIISTTTPLNITIESLTNKNALKVSNNLNTKSHSEGTGIGLVNLNERFKILANREIEIEKDTKFSVILPLIP